MSGPVCLKAIDVVIWLLIFNQRLDANLKTLFMDLDNDPNNLIRIQIS